MSGVSNYELQIFMYDVDNATTQLVSSSSAGILGNKNSAFAKVSDDGMFVTFQSYSNNSLVSTVGVRF